MRDRDTSGETVVDVKRKPTTATDYAGSESENKQQCSHQECRLS